MIYTPINYQAQAANVYASNKNIATSELLATPPQNLYNEAQDIDSNVNDACLIADLASGVVAATSGVGAIVGGTTGLVTTLGCWALNVTRPDNTAAVTAATQNYVSGYQHSSHPNCNGYNGCRI